VKLGLLAVVIVTLLVTGCSSNSKRLEHESSHRLAETQVRLGMGYMQKGDLDIALGKLKSAVATADDYAPAHNAIAILYIQLGQIDKADEHYKKALKVAEDDSGVVHNNYGAFLCNQQRYDEAFQHFIKATEQPLYKTPALAYENAGLCAMRAKNLPQAEDSFRKALEINGKLTVSLLNMARLALDNQRYLQGRAYIQRYEEVASHNPSTLQLAIKIEQGLNSESRVKHYKDMLKNRFPDSEQAGQLTE